LRHLSALPADHVPDRQDRERIATPPAFSEKLDRCVGCDGLSLDRCKLYDPLDRASQKGPGPRYLMGDLPEDTNG